MFTIRRRTMSSCCNLGLICTILSPPQMFPSNPGSYLLLQDACVDPLSFGPLLHEMSFDSIRSDLTGPLDKETSIDNISNDPAVLRINMKASDLTSLASVPQGKNVCFSMQTKSGLITKDDPEDKTTRSSSGMLSFDTMNLSILCLYMCKQDQSSMQTDPEIIDKQCKDETSLVRQTLVGTRLQTIGKTMITAKVVMEEPKKRGMRPFREDKILIHAEIIVFLSCVRRCALYPTNRRRRGYLVIFGLQVFLMQMLRRGLNLSERIADSRGNLLTSSLRVSPVLKIGGSQSSSLPITKIRKALFESKSQEDHQLNLVLSRTNSNLLVFTQWITSFIIRVLDYAGDCAREHRVIEHLKKEMEIPCSKQESSSCNRVLILKCSFEYYDKLKFLFLKLRNTLESIQAFMIKKSMRYHSDLTQGQKAKAEGFSSLKPNTRSIWIGLQQVHKQINNNPYTSFGFVMSLNDYRGLDVPTAKLFLIPTGKFWLPAVVFMVPAVVPAFPTDALDLGRCVAYGLGLFSVSSLVFQCLSPDLGFYNWYQSLVALDLGLIRYSLQQVHKQINNNPYTSFGFVMSLNDYRGLDVPTAKLMVPAGSSWFLLVGFKVPTGLLMVSSACLVRYCLLLLLVL
ncbi:hypothetical protein Tco_0749548 [Tanacetum coccineum]|uniref:Uncharacterized protein n=1 Tax=Tanacetum coccineum TaxID=301880 RepID=A0ABQ4Z1V1_9ASTR